MANKPKSYYITADFPRTSGNGNITSYFEPNQELPGRSLISTNFEWANGLYDTCRFTSAEVAVKWFQFLNRHTKAQSITLHREY